MVDKRAITNQPECKINQFQSLRHLVVLERNFTQNHKCHLMVTLEEKYDDHLSLKSTLSGLL